MQSVKVLDLELSQPLPELTNLKAYNRLYGLVRLHGVPLGEIQLPLHEQAGSERTLAQAILSQYDWAVARELVQRRLAHPQHQGWAVTDLLDAPPPLPAVLPTVTVAVCLQNTADLTCLDALKTLDAPDLEVLVISVKPDPHLADWIHQHAPQWQYDSPAQPSLNAARNLAIEKAQGEILAFTDERGVVDANWATALATAFAAHPEVMTITGLVVPAALENPDQVQFQTHYGLGRGCKRQWYHLNRSQPVPWPMLGTMQMGSGINMAFRRQVFEQIGRFNLALDQIELTCAGGDWEMFCRVLLTGFSLLYEPTALVRDRTIQTIDSVPAYLRKQIIGFYSFIAAGVQRYPHQWLNFACLALWKLAQLVKAYLIPGLRPRSWVATELQGLWQIWGRYRAAQAKAGPEAAGPVQPKPMNRMLKPMAVRLVDVACPLPSFTDLADYQALRLFVTAGPVSIGTVDLNHNGQPVSAARLRQAIADQLWLQLLALAHGGDQEAAWTHLQTVFAERWIPPQDAALAVVQPLSDQIPVSVIITTCDRPDDLANCLRYLQAQQTQRPLEIIVADNRPASGVTPPVIAQFPGVKLVQEARPGTSYGRNAAIAVSTGEMIVSIDDDVVVPPDWLEKLIAPLARPEVMVVTGNVLPLELETPAQLMFETLKGGLGSGFQPLEVNRSWLASFPYSPPVWELGVSANAAFRASIFNHPDIGLMDEVLGPGTPTGGAEENHLVYKILRAGYTLVYEPSAFVWHRHRRDVDAFYRQIYGQMKSCTAYHLILWLQEGDLRGRQQLTHGLPRYYSRQILTRLKGQHKTPWRFLWNEVAGYVAGYWGYWQSCQKVKRQGRSAPYIPVAERIAPSSAIDPITTDPTTEATDNITDNITDLNFSPISHSQTA